MQIKNANGHTAIGVFLCPLLLSVFFSVFSFLPNKLHASTNALDYQPFATRDQNIFNLIHGQALPSNAALIKHKDTQWSGSLAITNTINIKSNTDESIYLDYEAYRINLSYQYGLNENWNLKFDLPIIHLSGGFLDSAIDHWHDFFSLPGANRSFITDNQYNVNYTSQSLSLINVNSATTSLGNLQISAARKLIENENTTTMSLWASLKLPTGDENKLSGNGATDISAWLALNQKINDHWLLNINTGVVVLGKDNYQAIPLSDYAVYGHAMLGWKITDSINLKAQLQGHTSYYDESQLKILGSTYLLTFGGTVKINNCHQLDIALSEDIKVDASPDASFLINWRSISSRC